MSIAQYMGGKWKNEYRGRRAKQVSGWGKAMQHLVRPRTKGRINIPSLVCKFENVKAKPT